MITIYIEPRSVYGRTNYYVVGEPADAVNRLTGKRTVDANDIDALEQLGIRCRMVGRPEMPAKEGMVA